MNLKCVCVEIIYGETIVEDQRLNTLEGCFSCKVPAKRNKNAKGLKMIIHNACMFLSLKKNMHVPFSKKNMHAPPVP